MAWTERQQAAIDKRGTNLLVSAAAGSGKTSVLVERVRKLVMEEGVNIDEMLIVTFTNAAAAEMKERIYDALLKALAAPDIDPKDKAHLRNQLSLIGRANISTFHKFALEIVHRYYHVIGIKPNLAICDDAKQTLLRQEALDELMEEKYAEGSADFKAFLDCFCNSKGDDNARGIIEDFDKFLNSHADPQEWLEYVRDGSMFETYSEDYIKKQVEGRSRLALSYFEAAQDYLAEIPSLAAKNELDIMFCEDVLDAACTEGLEKVLEMLAGHKFNQMRVGKADKAAWEAIKTEVSALRDCGKDHHKYIKDNLIGLTDPGTEKQRKMLDNILETIISLTLDFSARYGEKKASQGLLDFADAEHFAIEILKDENVCREYREKFKHIFVDEYQDSNAVQDTLIESVSTGDNVFRVGDVKQSIYKFRLAEPELFLLRYDCYKDGSMPGEALDLNSNFRSKKDVIDLVNTIFSRIMTKDSADMEYTEDAALVKGSSYDGPLAYRPKLHLIDTASDEDSAETETDGEIEELKGIELEALKAVDIIRSYYGKPIFDDKKQKERPLRYKDMAVLLRATKGAGEVFYKIFTEAGIPVYMERSEGYFDAFEIQVFMNLLRIIDNTSRDIPLLSVLRAPVFGFCADELADIRIWAIGKDMRRSPYNKVFRQFSEDGPEGPLRDKCREFLEIIKRWQMQVQYTPLADFIWQLLNETGYSVFAAASPSGTQRLANLRALVDKAAAYEGENAGGLFGFINYIEAITSKKTKVNTGLAGILSENADVVRIMTIHKSKGLEFPFVLIGGLAKKFGGTAGGGQALFHKKYGISAKLSNPRNSLSYEPASYKLIKARQAEENLAEEIRVLYVALTRPKDIVVMTAAVKNAGDLIEKSKVKIPEDVEGCKTPLAMLLPALGDAADIEITSKYSLSISKKEADLRLDDLARGLEEGFEVDEAELPVSAEEVRRRMNYDYEPERDLQEKRKYSVSQIAAMEKKVYKRPPRVLASEEDQEEKLDAAERGTAYHAVMEHIPFTPGGKSPEEIQLFMEGLAEKHILTQAQVKAVDPTKISAFFDSAIGKEVLASKEIHKEASFTMRHEYGGRPVLVQGTIDCYFEQDGGWVLVDYKSNYIAKDRLAAEEQRLRDEYLPQLELYRKALVSATGKPVKKAVLYLFGADKEISIDN
ncbi:MAG: helicase-exonuclease AddAB subunit AddA [Clostridia bacterium]|nr:helicase-exonuclease AddAB subunit AddA [Clostridia bacterium]